MTARANGREALVAAIISDLNSLAAVGMDGRQLRAFVREHQIPHRTWRRHLFVRLDHVVAAMGLADAETPAPRPQWNEDEAIQEYAARPRGSR